MAKNKNKSKIPVKQDVPEAVNLSDLEVTTFSDANTVVAVAPINEHDVHVEVSVPDYTQIVAAAVLEPMLQQVPFNPMTCTAQDLADYKQQQMSGRN